VRCVSITERSGTALHFTREPAFRDVPIADAVGELLQVFDDLFDGPAATKEVPDNAVESVAAIDAFWCSLTDDLFNLVDGVLRRGASGNVRPAVAELCLALLAPNDRTIEQGVNVAKCLTDADLEPGNRERLAGPAK
jgi:hypothetical protein